MGREVRGLPSRPSATGSAEPKGSCVAKERGHVGLGHGDMGTWPSPDSPRPGRQLAVAAEVAEKQRGPASSQ